MGGRNILCKPQGYLTPGSSTEKPETLLQRTKLDMATGLSQPSPETQSMNANYTAFPILKLAKHGYGSESYPEQLGQPDELLAQMCKECFLPRYLSSIAGNTGIYERKGKKKIVLVLPILFIQDNTGIFCSL